MRKVLIYLGSICMLLAAGGGVALAVSSSVTVTGNNLHCQNGSAVATSGTVTVPNGQAVTCSATADAPPPPPPPPPSTVLLGNQTVQATSDSSSAPASEAFGYSAGTSGTATSVSVYLTSTSGATVGLYADGSSKPGALLDKGSIASNTAGWASVPLSGGARIVAGTRYWIAVGANSGSSITYRDHDGTGTNLDWSGSGFPNPYVPSGQWNSNPISAYVSGTTSPPPAPVPPSNTSAPTISGTPRSGQTLTANPGTWSGDTPMTFAYQWSNRATATGPTETLTDADVGTMVSVTVTASNDATPPTVSATSQSVGPVQAAPPPPPPGNYTLPADRTYNWNPGLNAVGGIPDANWTVSQTLSPSGGDDTVAIQAALDACPNNGVVKLNSGVFHISGQGLSIEHSYCVLRGAGPGPGNWPQGMAASGTGGTYLEKPSGTSYPVAIIGPRWPHDAGTATNLTSDAVRGSKSVTVASTAGLSVGQLVVVDETTDPNISHWNGAQTSGWFEEPNRPLGDTMEIASISGNTVTFSTDFPITYQVSQSAHLYHVSNQTNYSGVENLYIYGGEGGDGGGGIHLFNCAYCWVKHIEASYNDEPINIEQGFRDEIRDSYIHDAPGGLHNSSSSYGVVLNWYTSNTLVENNIVRMFDKMDVMRSAGGGNVLGYNYMDDGADLGGQWEETGIGTSHMATSHYELIEGNQAENFDQDDSWGNSVYITAFRNHLIGYNSDFSAYGPYRAIGVPQWHWWQSFVGNVLGTPTNQSMFNNTYETVGGGINTSAWSVCWQHADPNPDGGKCLSTVLRDGNYDYVSNKVHWHGIGGTGVNNGLTPPANATLPDSLYLTAKPAFFGSSPWPWVDGSSASNPLPGQLSARARYDAGTPNG